jgi:histone H3/H4
MRDNKSLLKLVQEAIDNGATTAEDVHKAIARLPLKVLVELKILRMPLKEASRIQDQAIGAIYDLIREINERVAKYAEQLLAKARRAGIGAAAPAGTRRAAAKPRSAATATRKAAPRRATAARAKR